MNRFKALKPIFIGAIITAPVLALAANSAPIHAVKTLNQQLEQKRQALEQEYKTKREALMQDFKTKREAFNSDSQKRVDNLKKKIGEERAKRVERLFGNMSRKFEGAIDRLNKLADRIDALLNKAASGGKDVSQEQDQLKAARDKIAAAEAALNDAKAQFGAMSASSDPKTAFQTVKTLVKGVLQKVKDAHAALVDVVSSLKGLQHN